LLKSLQPFLIAREHGRQNFERNVATNLDVTREIHFTHPARTNLRADFVTP
jgi:hypothetical protein